ncbi:DUF5107 domain-containing protein [Olivibacter domesticus]|uniref:Tetratricopeptide (TPR) repeat n=1 Tax=Olivibacter domesticus TaxID=407022 RepID=A0A1H7M161_OLID1|nr:DUF5107 domain-containing protein [Olivibacter domesticus]SEL04973.1 Tetratricopeptide (TPR) repeat [Olivibacter domesticus]
MHTDVNIWSEEITIPTYSVGKPEKNPMFLEKRVYQGSSGVVYPYPVIEKIANEKEDRVYHAVFLENSYLKIMILPELGGRIQMAYDKVKKRHFVYYNQVIKPALVGLTGPWISGGIEFNWPQHHRPSTFLPVDYTLEERGMGVKTIWINEVEVMFRTKAKVGFTLYPQKAYLEIEAHLTNRTLFPQTFLWWANPAVKVNDFYQSIFPPDVHAVFDHGKRDVSSFPIAKGVYYKMDYSPGTDISRYKNIPVPTSFMAVNSKYDFMGGYEYDTAAGMLHIANHHTVPGKKQWTWGNADFGQAWDRNLTDEDGPYIELMTGAYTDNQPDFSWLQPNEEKSFVQYFMPYNTIGMVKNANKNVAVHLDLQDGQLTLGVYATSTFKNIYIVLKRGSTPFIERTCSLSPSEVYIETITAGVGNQPLHDYLLEIYNNKENLLISYQPEKEEEREIPPPASPAPSPIDVLNTEELYLHGLHLEQYRHATFDPTAYYREALKRDAGDLRNNNAMGLWLLRRGMFEEAEGYFRKAKERLFMRNVNAYDSEVLYNLGLTLKFNNKLIEAYELFYKATWSAAWKDCAYLMLARIDVEKENYQLALEHAEASLNRNTKSGQILHLKVLILRKLEKYEEALRCADEALTLDPFNYSVYFEKHLLLSTLSKTAEAITVRQHAVSLMDGRVDTFIEYALDYKQAGCYDEAFNFLLWIAASAANNPLLNYHIGAILWTKGTLSAAHSYFDKASSCTPDYCFPNRIEDMIVLEQAIQLNSADAKAYYYLGNYWYDKRMHQKAISCWEESVKLDPHFATVKRNLALAYYNKLKEYGKAKDMLEEAFLLDSTDARVLMELDQLYKLQQVAPQKRLDFLEMHMPLVEDRDDLFLERITLLNLLGRNEEAYSLLNMRQFHPWEGGEGKVTDQFLVAGQELAKAALLNNDALNALNYLHVLKKYPYNLGEGKLPNTAENDVNYLEGLTYEQLGEDEKANQQLTLATNGDEEPVQAIFYNDPQPDKIFYQGLAWLKLGKRDKANRIFNKLLAFGNKHLHDTIAIDYMAVSLPDLLVFEQDLSFKNHIHCLYMIGLAALGFGNIAEAVAYFDQVLQLNNSHMGARIHKKMVPFLKQLTGINI